MSLKTEKLDIIEQILLIKDESLLLAIKNMLEFGLKHQEETDAVDFWDDLTDDQKQRIDKAIRELEAGQGIPHDEVMSRFREKYKA